MADFFALLKSDEIRRIALARETQVELEERFRAGADRFRREGLQLFALDGSGFRPDRTEAIFVEPFTLDEHIVAGIDEPLACPELTGDDLVDEGVKAIIGSYAQDQEPWLAFQVRDRRDLLTTRGVSLILDGGTYRKLNDPGLVVGDRVHAVLAGERLLFDNLWWARRAFHLSAHYHEATDEDLERFAARPDVFVEDAEAFVAGRNDWERARIGAILQSGVLDTVPIALVRERAVEYGVPLRVDADGDGNQQLVIPGDRTDLREILQFLEEKLYRGALTDTDYVANSRRRRQADA